MECFVGDDRKGMGCFVWGDRKGMGFLPGEVERAYPFFIGMFCMGWKKGHGIFERAWDVSSGWEKGHGLFCLAILCGMFCLRWQKVSGCFVLQFLSMFLSTISQRFLLI